MKALIILVALISLFSVNKSLEINQELFVSHLNHFNIKYGIIFYCESLNINAWNKVVQNELVYFSFYDISSTKFNLSEAWKMMGLNYRQIGITFDITCNKVLEIFSDFSRFLYFNASYNWLMFSNNYTNSLEVLKNQNINLDAEITLAVVTEGRDINLYDVYNPNSNSNGKLIVTPKGAWNENKLRITMTGSKFDQRSNLNGIVIHAGIVASSVEVNQTLKQYIESE